MNQIITIASTTTTDRLDKVYILLNSIKKNKNKDTKILYYLFIQYTPEYDEKYCEEYFNELYSDDFVVLLTDLDVFKREVKTKIRNHLYYAKCLFPSHFSDRILFLDVDMVCVNKGIEELWNTDLEDYYVGACIDPTWQFCPEYKDKENTRTNNYFNAGMLLFNITKIREDGKDKELRKWCLNWNYKELKYICYDQTLLNYILKDKVKLLDFKYNNSLLASLGKTQEYYRKYLKDSGYPQPFNSIYSAVILHFCGANKPWGEGLMKNKLKYPYKDEASLIWKNICDVYGKQLNMNKPKIKIIQYFVGDDKEYLELAHEVEKLNKKYAELHGYAYVFDYLDSNVIENYFNKCTCKEMAAYKLKYIFDNLMKNDCDILVFIDADAAVSKPSTKLEDLLDNEHELYLSRGNDIDFQIKHVNNILATLSKINKNNIFSDFWSNIIQKNVSLYGSLEVLSIGNHIHNEGFYIIKNTLNMRQLFKKALELSLFLGDTIYESPMCLEGRAMCLCLLKEKYHSLSTYLYSQVQGACASSFCNKYNPELSFILHEYGNATTKRQKLDEVKALWNNKWWRQVVT